MMLAYFQRGERISQLVRDLSDKLVRDVFFDVSMIVILATTVLIIFSVMRAKNLAKKLTAHIIHLYETLHQIDADRQKQGAVELHYSPSCKELNELHKTFNAVARTINLATASMKAKSMQDDQMGEALMSYSDAIHIFKKFDENHPQ